MYVCICNAVTDSEIKQAICDGACSMDCLQKQLDVATCCGKCHSHAEKILSSELGSVPIKREQAA